MQDTYKNYTETLNILKVFKFSVIIFFGRGKFMSSITSKGRRERKELSVAEASVQNAVKEIPVSGACRVT